MWKTLPRKWPLCNINLHERKSRTCSKHAWAWWSMTQVVTNQNQLQEACEGDGGGCQVLSFERGPTCLAWLQNLLAVEERQHVPSRQKNPMTFPSILTLLIQFWIETKHLFIQVIKPIIILLILPHIFKGILCIWPYFSTWNSNKGISHHPILYIIM